MESRENWRGNGHGDKSNGMIGVVLVTIVLVHKKLESTVL